MEDYVRSTEGNSEILTVGSFLRLYLKALCIKQNKFAIYIGLKPSKFSKILSGSRKLNMEQSMILGHLFNMHSKIIRDVSIFKVHFCLRYRVKSVQRPARRVCSI